ncbi:HepT-like ribonuclease domain-containing protein [Methyloligella solikamskensis]|uniref:DUF86 domain-containing protein n=1 Tax=Methyloligella solikamskensis TaxID=1177756 RepID=A0ABW3J9N5_9HYPH
MRDHIDFLLRVADEHSFEDFRDSRVLRYACQYAVLVIAEAANHLPPELKQRAPEVPWPNIISIGHKLRHEYHRVDPEIIWDIAINHASQLRRAVLRLLADEASLATDS